MKKPKIYLYEHFTALEQKLKQKSEFEIFKSESEIDLHEFNLLSKKNYLNKRIKIPFSEIDCLIIRTFRTISQIILNFFPNLSVILRPGHGYDNIDIQACTSHKVFVFNTAGIYTNSTADLTVGLIINALRHIKKADAYLRQNLWKREELIGKELRDLTMCIVGLGRVGSAVARRLLAFGCKIIAVDPYKNPETPFAIALSHLARGTKVHRAAGGENVPLKKGDRCETSGGISVWEQNYFRTVPDISDIMDKVTFLDLKSALKIADVVSLHIPLTAETELMFKADEFELMKQDSVFINAARGKIVDEVALYEALVSGHLSAAAVDTFTVEPPTKSPLLELENFTGTQHIGSQTNAATIRAVDVSVEILEKVLIDKDYTDALNYMEITKSI